LSGFFKKHVREPAIPGLTYQPGTEKMAACLMKKTVINKKNIVIIVVVMTPRPQEGKH